MCNIILYEVFLHVEYIYIYIHISILLSDAYFRLLYIYTYNIYKLTIFYVQTNIYMKVNEAIDQAKHRMTEQELLLKQITLDFTALKASVESIKANEVDLQEEIKTGR